ncbi:MAG: enoyl-CoA hydratase/isomerase family protein [Planctomycetota bacterium]|nr:MAG: enoyl-CoA hydratase/isomerase family protein [Planctomycetota bacterium]
MADYEFHKVEIADGVATVTWNRPPVNFFNMALMKELTGILDGLAKDDSVRVIALTGEGKFFSAGVDVGEHMGDMATEMIKVFHGLFHKMNEVPQPLIALVNGQALGGGAEVVLGCDMAFAHEKSKWGQPEIKVGVYPPIALVLLPRKVGRMKAMELVLAGDVIPAQEAKDLGLYNEVVPLDSFADAAKAFVGKFASLSAPVLKITKRALLQGLTGIEDFKLALRPIEELYLNELMKTEDANEGLKAFLEKRDPVWKHK